MKIFLPVSLLGRNRKTRSFFSFFFKLNRSKTISAFFERGGGKLYFQSISENCLTRNKQQVANWLTVYRKKTDRYRVKALVRSFRCRQNKPNTFGGISVAQPLRKKNLRWTKTWLLLLLWWWLMLLLLLLLSTFSLSLMFLLLNAIRLFFNSKFFFSLVSFFSVISSMIGSFPQEKVCTTTIASRRSTRSTAAAGRPPSPSRRSCRRPGSGPEPPPPSCPA